jgi:secreted PhoX family phosphatase
VLESPDNICVSPRGGIVLCEDGGGQQFLRGLTPQGQIFDFLATRGSASELAGACFAPAGDVLFFNQQGSTDSRNTASPGATYAIWGPWANGVL